MSPRKVRFVVDSIRGLSVRAALAQLDFSKKTVAGPIAKLVRSGIANAMHNHDIKEETLIVKTAFVDEGSTLHRWTPRAFGRASRINKRTSHITLVLEGDASEKSKKAAEKIKEAELVAEQEKGGIDTDATDSKGSVETKPKAKNVEKKSKPNVIAKKQTITKRRGNK